MQNFFAQPNKWLIFSNFYYDFPSNLQNIRNPEADLFLFSTFTHEEIETQRLEMHFLVLQLIRGRPSSGLSALMSITLRRLPCNDCLAFII